MLTIHTTVPANKTYKALQALRALGFGTRSIGEMAEIGRTTICKVLNGKKTRVDPDTERSIVELLNTERERAKKPKLETCLECGLSHAKADRLKRVLRLLPATGVMIQEAYPCTYPITYTATWEYADKKSEAAARMMYRDLHDLGAESVGGVWAVHTKPYPSSPETDTT